MSALSRSSPTSHAARAATARRDRRARSAGRSQQRDDPRVAIDLGLVDDLDLVEANEPRQSPQTVRREALIDKVIARVHVPRLVNLDRGPVGGQTRAVGLEHNLAARSQHIRKRPQQPDRISDPGARCPKKTQRNIEPPLDSCTSSASMRRYCTRDPTSPAIAGNPAPP